MSTLSPSVLALALAIASLAALPAAGFAQEATPDASPVASPDTTECLVEPRPLAFYEDAVRDVVTAATPATPVFDEEGGTNTPTPLAISEEGSRPADATTAAAVEETVWELAACANAGDSARFLSLYSEQAARDGLAFVLSRSIALALAEGTPAAVVEEEAVGGLDGLFVATPRPLPAEDRATVVAVRNVRVLADGRVVADVVSSGSEGEQEGRGVFVEEGGRYRIAGSAPPLDDGTPAATPVP